MPAPEDDGEPISLVGCLLAMALAGVLSGVVVVVLFSKLLGSR